ncbi:MAG: hypothetical protein M1415_10770, partial [Firmicutes bacterium]|nr:hypothetical protein [Bacillota bacterium]
VVQARLSIRKRMNALVALHRLIHPRNHHQRPLGFPEMTSLSPSGGNEWQGSLERGVALPT